MGKQTEEELEDIVDELPDDDAEIVEGDGEEEEPSDDGEEDVEGEDAPDDDAEVRDDGEEESEEPDGDGEEPEEEDEAEPDDEDDAVEAILSGVKEKARKREAAPIGSQDEDIGEFDFSKTEYFQLDRDMQEINEAAAKLDKAINDAEEEGDDRKRIELLAEKKNLEFQARQLGKRAPELAEKARLEEIAYNVKKDRVERKKLAASEVERLSTEYASVRKFPGLKLAIKNIIYEGRTGDFAQYRAGSVELEKALIRYALKEGFLSRDAKPVEAPVGKKAAAPIGKKKGAGTVRRQSSAPAPAKPAGGKRTWNGEPIPPQYSTLEYKTAREAGYTAEEISVKYKGKNLLKEHAH